MNNIYLDNAATTKLSEDVLEEMLPFFTEIYGNPSTVYSMGRNSKKYVENARKSIASCINSKYNEIFFTSGGTEANNWAILGCINIKEDVHIITSSIEHHSILNICKFLQIQGVDVTYLPVNENGLISIDNLQNSIKYNTKMISVMFVNNETGVIQPIKQIGEIAKKNNILFHTDAVSALNYIDIDVNEFNIDLMSMSAHKIHGPKGIGAIYVRNGVNMNPMILGGSQERGKRGGTENVAGIIGFAKALQITKTDMFEKNHKLISLRDRLINELIKNIPNCYLNGEIENRVSSNANICFKFAETALIIMLLDMEGIFVSGGSACSSGAIEPSHVLLAMGLSESDSICSVRFTLSAFNTDEEVDTLLNVLPRIIENIRNNIKEV
jgi:cysteine desulfurase